MSEWSAFVWSWAYANAIARYSAKRDKIRYRVSGYRTGIPSAPWGYSIQITGPRKGNVK